MRSTIEEKREEQKADTRLNLKGFFHYSGRSGRGGHVTIGNPLNDKGKRSPRVCNPRGGTRGTKFCGRERRGCQVVFIPQQKLGTD